MKTKRILILVIISFCFTSVFAQNFSIGIENGINFSNIRKDLNYQRHIAQPGPVNGIVAQYNLGNWFVLQSGVDHTTYYYNETNKNQYNPHDYYTTSSLYTPPSSFYDPSLLSSYSPPSTISLDYYSMQYYSSNQSKYSFLRIPLLVKFKTPGRVNFEIGGGAYYAFLTNDEYRGKDKDIIPEEFRNENFPPMNDWGWIMNSSVHYNINSKWNVFVSGQVTTGNKIYFEDSKGKMGSTEVTFGVAYKPFNANNYIEKNDTLGKKIKVIPNAGFNISWANASKNPDQYSSTVGFSSGVSVNFMLDKNVSLSTGVSYDRKGYKLNYNGNYTYIYNPPLPVEEPFAPKLLSQVKLDYITFPLKFEIAFGKKIQSNINFGAYFSLLQNSFAEGEKIETYNYGQGYQVTKNYFNESLDQYFKKADGGFMFGYRMDIPVFNWADIFISVNQSMGVVDILTDKEDPIYNERDFYGKISNNSLSFLFGLNIPVNKN